MIRDDFDRIFSMPNLFVSQSATKGTAPPTIASTGESVDIIIHPSAIRSAPLLKDVRAKAADHAMASDIDDYVQDVLTVPASLGGLPALSVPLRVREEDGGDGWPIGASIVGQWGSDELVLRVGEMLQELQA
jgi:aspartyl-tRNA(Asn)/glutamyl-tRNA(Gln) amidotransferase subunit A